MKKGLYMVIVGMVTGFIVILPSLGFTQSAGALVAPETTALGRSDSPYTLGISDVVKIEVRNQPEFTAVGIFLENPIKRFNDCLIFSP